MNFHWPIFGRRHVAVRHVVATSEDNSRAAAKRRAKRDALKAAVSTLNASERRAAYLRAERRGG